MFSLSDPCVNRQNAITLSNLRVKSATIKIIELIMEAMRYIYFFFCLNNVSKQFYIRLNFYPCIIYILI